MHSNTPYTAEFYKNHRDGSLRSARQIVPIVIDLIRPKSVIDVGCGAGTWLSVFSECGVEDFYGVDGDYVDRRMLEIPQERFLAFDLAKPIRLNRQFDVVVSLEVAEHLPDSCAEIFIDSLTKLAPVILFSAAIPHQGGTRHINEQWPEYWANYFQTKGYPVIDSIRKKVWASDEVEYCYAQNTFLFARIDYLEKNGALKHEYRSTDPSSLSMVHPRKYLEVIDWVQQLYLMSEELAAVIPPDKRFVLIDQGAFGSLFSSSSRAIPFLKDNGQWSKMPSDAATAIEEVEQLRRLGVSFIVIAWPAFWWLDDYSDFKQYLRSNFHCTLENGRLIAFDLRP